MAQELIALEHELWKSVLKSENLVYFRRQIDAVVRPYLNAFTAAAEHLIISNHAKSNFLLVRAAEWNVHNEKNNLVFHSFFKFYKTTDKEIVLDFYRLSIVQTQDISNIKGTHTWKTIEPRIELHFVKGSLQTVFFN